MVLDVALENENNEQPFSEICSGNEQPNSKENMVTPLETNKLVDSQNNIDPDKENIEESNDTKQNYNSDDETFQLTRKITNKKQAIADSDSDDFEITTSLERLTDATQHSDLEKESQEQEKESQEQETKSDEAGDLTKKKKKRIAIVDSDSDEENVESKVNTTYESSETQESVIYTTNHKGEIMPEDALQRKSNWTALCDSDSNDEDQYNETVTLEDNNDQLSEDTVIQPKPYRKKSKKKNEENPKKMTGKEAAQQRREIQSESQRMLRETNISLPYHRPKAFTLKEFLARRPRFASAVPSSINAPPSVAIKMSRQQLEIVTKNLKQHEKQIKEFYKSDSESEDEEDQNDKDFVPPGQEENISTTHTESSEEKPSDEGIISNKMGKTEDMAQDSGIDTQEMVEDNAMEIGDNHNKTVESTEEPVMCSSRTSEGFPSVKSIDESEKQKIDNTEEETENEKMCITETTEEDVEKPKNTELSRNNIQMVGEESTEPNAIEQYSMDYEFNLDDIEESTEKFTMAKDTQICNKKIPLNRETIENSPKDMDLENISGSLGINTDEGKHDESQPSQDLFDEPSSDKPKGFENTELDREIENFGNTKEVQPEKPKMSKMDLIREKLANIQPRLSGRDNDFIDLDSDIARPNEVTKLMQRFMQHTTKRHCHKNKVKLSIVSVQSGEIHKETVDMTVDDDDDPREIEEKPGAKLQKLREELQNQMALQRLEIRQKKATPNLTLADEDKDIYDGEKSDCESSEEENLEELEDKPRKDEIKSAFLDDEADESDREEEDEADDADDEDEINEEDEDMESESNENEKTESLDVCEEVGQIPVKKTMKRILKGFTEDSDDEDDNFDLSSQNDVTKAIENLDRCIDGEVTQDDDYLPPHQPQNSKTPIRQTSVSRSKSDFEFLTPVSYITGLQNLSTASKSKNGSPFQMPNVPSPLKEANWHSNLQKKLFTDSEITNSQAEAIAELCSDKTSFTQDKDNFPLKTGTDTESAIPCTAPPNTQDLLNICSGEFEDDSQAEFSSSALPTSQDLLDVCSGEFTGVSQVISEEDSQTRQGETLTFNSNQEVKNLGAEEDMIISQLLDEEEMENFKKKFVSPLMTNTQRRIVEEFEEVAASGGVIDSDDDCDEGLVEKKKKKNQKKLTFSDDSSDEEEEEEAINLHDQVDEDEEEEGINLHEDDEDEEDIPADNIGYDSEENEVEYVNDKGKAADFFDKEAELSESEWGSADEDEKDLDTMEFEQGDTEKFDEKKMRSDLEKIHMRRMLDDDTREVKLLQELLLEDGELHGSKRERQFRWKNIDSMNDGEEENKEDNGEAFLDEEESEEQWRKKRHEIQMFLKEKQAKSESLTDDNDDLLSDSQLLKIGHEVLKSNSQSNTPVEKQPQVTSASPDIKSTFSFMHKRGSFLSRSDQVLQRLANYNKETTIAANKAKNSRNFLFQTVAIESTISVGEEKKRKATDGTPKFIKKLRLSDNMSPAVNKKKKTDQLSAKAKLF
ncbi:hypothetical protein JTB14_028767 [Gonioctena quinquepunctata]|nr:hypothetical protein JTB14_028767 [Gonioctena quinquepunctata]